MCLQALNWNSNRPLAELGKDIYEGKYNQPTKADNHVTLEESEYIKNVILEGIGKRPWNELRLRFKPHSLILPTHNDLHDYEKSIRYGLIPFEGGWRATLPEILNVSSVETI